MRQREEKMAMDWKDLHRENVVGQKGVYNKEGRHKIKLIISIMTLAVGLALVCQ